MKYDNTLLIGITGKAGSGKDTLCDMMCDFLLTQPANTGTYVSRFALADQLKKTAAAMYGVNFNIFNTRSRKEQPHAQLNNQSPREVLQQFGTEYVRENLGEDHWIKMVEKDIQAFSQMNPEPTRINVAIIPDVRFANEREWIEENSGVLIKIERTEEDLDVGDINTEHASETEAYTDFEYDMMVYNDDTLMHLRLHAKAILNAIGLT